MGRETSIYMARLERAAPAPNRRLAKGDIMRRTLLIPIGSILLMLLGIPGIARCEQAKETIVNIGGVPQKGAITDFDSSGFKFKLSDVDLEIYVKWDQVDPGERTVLRNSLGVDKISPGGAESKVSCQRVELTNGEFVVGLLLPDEEIEEAYFLKRSNTTIRVEKRNVRQITEVSLPETDVYKPMELYDRAKAQIEGGAAAENLSTPAGHYKLALRCAELALPAKAEEHLKKCVILDEKYQPERVVELSARIAELHKKSNVQKLDAEISASVNAKDLGAALESINQLLTDHPSSKEAANWKALKPGIEAEWEKMAKGRVITLYHVWMERLIHKALTTQVSDGAQKPGKIVRTKIGVTYTGDLLSEDDAKIVLKANDTEIHINKAEIVEIQDYSAGAGKLRYRTLAECRAYVTNPIAGEIRAATANDLKVSEAFVEEAWKERARLVIEVGSAGVKTGSRTSIEHEVSYGPGSWLAAGAAAIAPAAAPAGAAAAIASADAVDPEEWWKALSINTKVQILKAFCAEAIMEVTKVSEVSCPSCGGVGGTKRVGSDGKVAITSCGYCRGAKTIRKIEYR